MSDETEAIEEAFTDSAGDADQGKGKHRRSGPGFLFGLVLGLIAGAVAAKLLVPPAGEELTRDAGSAVLEPPAHDVDFDTTIGRMRALLDQIRARVREASREAEIAARETEEMAHARYAELTHQNGSGE